MTDSLARRIRVATRLRDLGHDFVARELDDAELDALADEVEHLAARVRRAPVRERRLSADGVDSFKMAVPSEGQIEKHQLFADSIVSGHANPMGLGAQLWREGDVAVMEVTLGRAFEGAPGRSHGGVVAALVDETMGLVMGMQGVLAFTAQLDLSFLAPTPIERTVTARAWLASREGRKLTMRASVSADGRVVAEAEALFVEVDPAAFLEHLLED